MSTFKDKPLKKCHTDDRKMIDDIHSIIVKDLNGDGIITDDDKTILGDPYPEIVWSLTNDFKIGNFDLSVMIQGSQGAEVKNIGDQYFFTHWTGGTSDEQAVVNAGIISDASFLQPRIHTNDVVQSAGYFSLRNVTASSSVSFPEKAFASSSFPKTISIP